MKKFILGAVVLTLLSPHVRGSDGVFNDLGARATRFVSENTSAVSLANPATSTSIFTYPEFYGTVSGVVCAAIRMTSRPYDPEFDAVTLTTLGALSGGLIAAASTGPLGLETGELVGRTFKGTLLGGFGGFAVYLCGTIDRKLNSMAQVIDVAIDKTDKVGKSLTEAVSEVLEQGLQKVDAVVDKTDKMGKSLAEAVSEIKPVLDQGLLKTAIFGTHNAKLSKEYTNRQKGFFITIDEKFKPYGIEVVEATWGKLDNPAVYNNALPRVKFLLEALYKEVDIQPYTYIPGTSKKIYRDKNGSIEIEYANIMDSFASFDKQKPKGVLHNKFKIRFRIYKEKNNQREYLRHTGVDVFEQTLSVKPGNHYFQLYPCPMSFDTTVILP